MNTIRALARQVRIGAPDASLTASGGVVAIAELVDRLGIVAAVDDALGPVKQRRRGLTGGQLLVAVAQAQMLGAAFWAGLERQRADTVGQALSAVETPASTTAAGIAARFGPAQVAGVEDAVGEICCRVISRLPAPRGRALREGPATIDLDGTDVECYGRAKTGVVYNYKGQRAGRPHVACWAQAGVAVAADLLAGDQDPRPGAGALIGRAVGVLQAAGVASRPAVRGDVGYFAADIAHAALEAGCDFSLGVTRNPAVWRSAAAVEDTTWTAAERMSGAQVAVCGYVPGGWPPGTRCVVRRVRVPADQVSTDPRARRRRTIPAGQLALALDGLVDHVWAYSFILTNLDVSSPQAAVTVEAWHRMRTDIEDRFRDAKHGAGLRHLPSGSQAVNTVWMWAALLAINLSAWLQELAGLDHGDGRGRAHVDGLRHRLLTTPGRLVRHAGQVVLRLPPSHDQLLARVLARLRRLPAWT